MIKTIDDWIIEADIAMLQAALQMNQVSSVELVEAYLRRISKYNPMINAVLEVNPDAIDIARVLDQERAAGGCRGPLHGIPILLKDNIGTHDHMHTSAGSIALAEWIPDRDSFVAEQLRRAGAVLLGKTNMTEWAGYMSSKIWAGYSSRGGLVLNPYGPGELFVGGSSSGSAAAVAASFCAAAVGTETSGSIISPSSQNCIVGIKPSIGLVSRAGIIPLAHSQDTAGPMARSVRDAAILLGVLAGSDPDDEVTTALPQRSTTDYTTYLNEDLSQVRIGIPRAYYQGLDEARLAIVEDAIRILKSQGATVIDPVQIPSIQVKWSRAVMRHEFKSDLNAYLSKLPAEIPVHSLSDVIAYNEAHADRALKYGQDTLIWSNETSGTLTEQEYSEALAQNRQMAGEKGIDAVIQQHKLDALLFLGNEGGSDLAARAGYPSITVPGGYAETGIIAPGGYTTKGPQGITFVGRAFSEAALIGIAYGFEQASCHRRAPDWDKIMIK